MNTFDPIWEKKYEAGHAERYPWDTIVSFVYRFRPRHKSRGETRILEVGCGTGSNLWFAAREGFQVAGIDGSESAIRYAQHRFAEEGLQGDLRVAQFTALPFPDAAFDLVIDRGSLTCCGHEAGRRAIAEIRRVLAPGGFFFFNPYSEHHSSFAGGRPGADGVRTEIAGGSLVGVGQIAFYGRQQIEHALASGWKVHSLQHLDLHEMVEAQTTLHAEWRVIAEKLDA